MYILSQIFMIIAIFLVFACNLAKNKKSFMLMQILECTSLAIGYILLGASGGLFAISICLLRNILTYFNKYNKNIGIVLIIILMGLNIGSAIVKHSIIEIIPGIAASYYSISMLSEDIAKCKKSLLYSSLMYLIYDFIVLNYMGCIKRIICVFGWIIYKIKNKKKVAY